MKKIILATAILATTAFSSEINNSDYNKIIKNACYQKNLIQKMYKSYIMIGTDNTYKNPIETLKKDIILYEDNNNKIDSFISENKIKDKGLLDGIKEQKAFFAKLKKEVDQKGTVDSSVKMLEKVSALVEISDNTCVDLITYSKDKTKIVISELADEASAAYTMSYLYMLKSWANSEKIEGDLEESIETFEENLEELSESEIMTPEIENLLIKTSKMFMHLKVMNESKTKFIPTLISRNADRIKDNMLKATDLYLIELEKIKSEK